MIRILSLQNSGMLSNEKGGHKMNFIDKAIENKNQMSSDDFLQAMADVYEEPEVWKVLEKYPQFIQDVIYIIDYDTILQTDGLDFFISYNEENFDNTVTALINCNATEEADILKKAKIIAADDNLETDERIEKIGELEGETALYNGQYDDFWDCVRNYIEMNF